MEASPKILAPLSPLRVAVCFGEGRLGWPLEPQGRVAVCFGEGRLGWPLEPQGRVAVCFGEGRLGWP